jgi:hypothetical protein
MEFAADFSDTDTIGLIVTAAVLGCLALIAWRQGAFRPKAERKIEE